MKRPWKIAAAGALGILLLLSVASLTFGDLAEERVAYKAQVEPICKQNRQANERVLKGVKQNIKAGKQRMALQLTSTVNKANNTVLAYEFKYCRVQTSRFV